MRRFQLSFFCEVSSYLFKALGSRCKGWILKNHIEKISVLKVASFPGPLVLRTIAFVSTADGRSQNEWRKTYNSLVIKDDSAIPLIFLLHVEGLHL